MTVTRNFPQGQSMHVALVQKATLGEGLAWHAATARWWWTDIQASNLYAWEPQQQAPVRLIAPDRVGSFAHCRSGRLLLGLSKQLCFAELPDLNELGSRQLQVEFLSAVDAAEPRTRINDGRTDRSGNFVFGTMNEGDDKRPIGSFYQYSQRHGLRRLALPAVSIANSICFSPDGTTLYFCDTRTQTIMQCDYDAESAQVAHIRLFCSMDQQHAYPDGSIVDSTGFLWNAQWGAGRVVQYSPEGRLIRSITVPTKNPTCPAFGGAHLDELCVTSSRQEMSAQEFKSMPHAGSLFAMSIPGTTGINDALFDDRSTITHTTPRSKP